MRIGIVVATDEERNPFYEIFGKPIDENETSGFEVSIWSIREDDYMVMVRSGPGEIAAAQATQFLITSEKVEKIINYGVAGGLHAGITNLRAGFVEKVVHYDFNITSCGKYKRGEYPHRNGEQFFKPKLSAIKDEGIFYTPHYVCASADRFVRKGAPRKKLRSEFNADICEMEAAGVLLTCNRNEIPCLIIKSVSDGINDNKETLHKNIEQGAKNCVKLLNELIEIDYI